MMPLGGRGARYFVNTKACNVITDARFRTMQLEPATRGTVDLEPKLFLYDCGDIHPSSTPNRNYPTFAGCKELFVFHNDKNFNYYWIDNVSFPNVEKIHFSGSMAEYVSYGRFPKEVWEIEASAQYFPPDYPRTPYDDFIAKLVKEGFLIPKEDVPEDAPKVRGRFYVC